MEGNTRSGPYVWNPTLAEKTEILKAMREREPTKVQGMREGGQQFRASPSADPRNVELATIVHPSGTVLRLYGERRRDMVEILMPLMDDSSRKSWAFSPEFRVEVLNGLPLMQMEVAPDGTTVIRNAVGAMPGTPLMSTPFKDDWERKLLDATAKNIDFLATTIAESPPGTRPMSVAVVPEPNPPQWRPGVSESEKETILQLVAEAKEEAARERKEAEARRDRLIKAMGGREEFISPNATSMEFGEAFERKMAELYGSATILANRNAKPAGDAEVPSALAAFDSAVPAPERTLQERCCNNRQQWSIDGENWYGSEAEAWMNAPSEGQ